MTVKLSYPDPLNRAEQDGIDDMYNAGVSSGFIVEEYTDTGLPRPKR